MSYNRLDWQQVERSLNKLTTKELKPLKPKHVTIVAAASYQKDIPIGEMVRVLFSRAREYHWAITFKALIVVQILIKEGCIERIMPCLKLSTDFLNMETFRDRSSSSLGALQTKNIKAFGTYLENKVSSYSEVKMDFVTEKETIIKRFKSAGIENGFLSEIQILQRQINSLLNCSFYTEEINNVVTLQAYRLLVIDLMALFHVLNEGVIKILGAYFELPKNDATRSLSIYKLFGEQAVKINTFFDVARKLHYELGIDIPEIKHPPVSLAKALEDYLNSPNFEQLRKDYKDKKSGKKIENNQKDDVPRVSESKNTTQAAQPIDFFASITSDISNFNQISQINQNNFSKNEFYGNLESQQYQQQYLQQNQAFQNKIPQPLIEISDINFNTPTMSTGNSLSYEGMNQPFGVNNIQSLYSTTSPYNPFGQSTVSNGIASTNLPFPNMMASNTSHISNMTQQVGPFTQTQSFQNNNNYAINSSVKVDPFGAVSNQKHLTNFSTQNQSVNHFNQNDNQKLNSFASGNQPFQSSPHQRDITGSTVASLNPFQNQSQHTRDFISNSTVSSQRAFQQSPHHRTGSEFTPASFSPLINTNNSFGYSHPREPGGLAQNQFRALEMNQIGSQMHFRAHTTDMQPFSQNFSVAAMPFGNNQTIQPFSHNPSSSSLPQQLNQSTNPFSQKQAMGNNFF